MIRRDQILISQRGNMIDLIIDHGCTSNNFFKFEEALAGKALNEYGDLGRLIESGEYYVRNYLTSIIVFW